jgi:hypothetical protein
MKRLRQLFVATILTILLTNLAVAEGVMQPWYAPPPPPPAATKTMPPQAAAAGEVNTNSEEPAIDLATEITLRLIQSMLAFF